MKSRPAPGLSLCLPAAGVDILHTSWLADVSGRYPMVGWHSPVFSQRQLDS